MPTCISCTCSHICEIIPEVTVGQTDLQAHSYYSALQTKAELACSKSGVTCMAISLNGLHSIQRTLHLHWVTNTIVVLSLCVAGYSYLAIDVRRQKLYFTDTANTGGRIGELSTNGRDHRILINVADCKPGAIVLDDKNR